MMGKFAFLLGEWNLEYKVPKSSFGETDSGTGQGTFKRVFNDKYVFFDYECSLSGGDGRAHGVFAWDGGTNLYRFWWFEDSGSYMQATCDFINDYTLLMHWDFSLLKQTFQQVGKDKVILRMEGPGTDENYELLMEVVMTRI
jgi:hypothetical protein